MHDNINTIHSDSHNRLSRMAVYNRITGMMVLCVRGKVNTKTQYDNVLNNKSIMPSSARKFRPKQFILHIGQVN